MLPDKSVLLEQINTAIKKNLCKKSTEENGYPLGSDSIEISGELTDKNYFSYTRNLESIKKLEHRLEALENQNDLLLYFIHFLYKNFAELVRDILLHDKQEVNRIEVKDSYEESLYGMK